MWKPESDVSRVSHAIGRQGPPGNEWPQAAFSRLGNVRPTIGNFRSTGQDMPRVSGATAAKMNSRLLPGFFEYRIYFTRALMRFFVQ
jgi:hypothetical protein